MVIRGCTGLLGGTGADGTATDLELTIGVGTTRAVSAADGAADTRGKITASAAGRVFGASPMSGAPEPTSLPVT